MPTELVFSNSASVKVSADIDAVETLLASGRGILETNRFAGFRGEEAVGAERIIVSVSAIAYAISIPAP